MSQLSGPGRARHAVRRPVTWVVLGVLGVLLAVGLGAFQPWRLWTHSTIDEALPGAEFVPAAPQPPAAPQAPAAPAVPPPHPGPVVLAEGRFVTQEHETTGVARVLQLPDGSRLVRLADFSTSDGPDLHVWVTDQTAGGEWGKYDDGRYLALGELKATDGNQNYAIPAAADLAGLTSVVIWCDRFNVAFGSAPLTL
ncbi:MAG TPA: DM13 domain-containing protein [Pseudonocardiaceae bacterium]|nr:DM13 domain-containing protein [Pseudonocardiaceae bacterium]